MSAKTVNHKVIEYTVDQIDLLVSEIQALMPECSIIALSGPLGAGKTTLARELLRAQGIEGVISSPTFTYVNRYENAHQNVFYHFDLYRFSAAREFQDAGFEEYLYQPHSWAIIEWPEIIKSLFKHGVCQVTISYHEDNAKRKAEIVRILECYE